MLFLSILRRKRTMGRETFIMSGLHLIAHFPTLSWSPFHGFI